MITTTSIHAYGAAGERADISAHDLSHAGEPCVSIHIGDCSIFTDLAAVERLGHAIDEAKAILASHEAERIHQQQTQRMAQRLVDLDEVPF